MNNINLGVSQSMGYENVNLELIKVTTNGQGQQLVSGRELHEALKIEKAFSTWIQAQLENVGAIENQDFCDSFKGNASLTQEEMREMSSQQRSAYGVSIDYILTLDTAKEICMVVGVAPRTNEETRQLSKAVRKYFIQCEKALHNPYAHLSKEFQAIIMHDEKIMKLERRVEQMEENASLAPGEYSLVSKRISSRINTVLKERGINRHFIGELYKALNRDIKEVTGIQTRTQLRQKHLNMVLELINDWQPSRATIMSINQMSLEI